MRVNRGKKSYTGGQYTGGRAKGRKNLAKVDGGYMNQNNVFFTAAEKKALETAVNTANRKRARMLKQEAQVPIRIFGEDSGARVGERQKMGYESDFILAPKSKSLQRFKSRAEYENYMANLRRVNDRGYIDERTEQYRQNYATALDRAFGEEAEDIKERIAAMSPKEYREWVAGADETLEIGYIYLPSRRTIKLNAIRRSLGMDDLDVPDDDIMLDLRRRTKRRK